MSLQDQLVVAFVVGTFAAASVLGQFSAFYSVRDKGSESRA